MRNHLQSVCLIIILQIIETKSAAFLSKSRNEITKKTYVTSATPLLASVSEPATFPNKGDAEYDYNSDNPSLPELFPEFAESLTSLGYATPTPIQDSSAQRALDGENLLLIAPTGSGKTLAYYLPALSKAMREDGTVLVVSPTRELALQLCGDAVSLLSTEMDNPESRVLLAVRGVAPPNAEQLSKATMLIGTPPELYTVLTKVDRGYGFIAGDTLSAVILDEADVLLPPPPKGLRTGLDTGSQKKNQKNANSPQDQRRKQEQRRKLLTAKRQGIEFTSTNQIVSPTEKILNMIASSSLIGGDNASPAQILAGSATASRKTLDRLNKSLRNAAVDAALPYDMVWSGDFKACRPVEGPLGANSAGDSESASKQADEAQHTIRAVTVPPQVTHQYVQLNKESATQATEIFKAVASVTKTLKPDIALVFLCGEFAKTKEAAKAKAKPVPKGATAKARRNSMLKYNRIADKVKSQEEKKKNATPKDSLSARNACSILKDFGVDAKPLHVALGLEGRDDVDEEDDSPSFLVTFEGSARGLHFDNVDVVFVVGRPKSAASYLHLAGRVGRSSADNGSIVVRPGKVVSFCTKGSSVELEKWVKQTGGKSLGEISIS
mmetsp:Transcript_16900/g.25567  ORF Transcript_16900/g.25567 Transcript_16900/m.25567 type:complete len:609 (-) Transcript_16900:88-1914(-)